MIDQPCSDCGRPDSPFGYGPPGWKDTFWRCGAHRLEGPVLATPRPPRPRVTPGPRLIDFGVEVGNNRQNTAIALNLRNNNGLVADDDEGREMHIGGALTEAAAWKYLKPIHWNWRIYGVTPLPDLGRWTPQTPKHLGVEVKGTRTSPPILIVPPKKNTKLPPPREWAYLLVDIHERPVYELVGWLWGHEFLDNWDETLPRPAWCSRGPFHPVETLLVEVRRHEVKHD